MVVSHKKIQAAPGFCFYWHAKNEYAPLSHLYANCGSNNWIRYS